ncbi:MAG TPA: hypothetical protein VNT79_13860, partial [Phycisphaerae bacterium]|nr:hypothetical protein [Phycisphaerae bacterium]
MNSDNGYRSFCRRLGLNICALLVSVSALSCETGPADPGGNDNNAGSPNPAVWSAAFLTEGAGALSSVWGSGPEDVFIVGGKPEQGEVYHFDGNNWRRMNLPPVSMLVWVFGFGPNDVFAVGFEGGVIRYDGIQWQMLDTGTSESLWGVWGKSPDDLWIVGGDSAPLILHFDGSAFTRVEAPANDRDAESLFKVWGIGRKAFVVGDNGLILELIDGDWEQVPGGADADDDFVSLWGTGESHIFAVGGRTSARVARYDGTAWTTHKPDATPGLNGAFLDGSIAICGGVGGFVGSVDLSTGEVTAEESGATLDIHAVWGDGAGRHYAVGGRFSGNLEGIALVRTVGEPTTSPAAPLPPICHSDDECDDANACTADRCDDGECTHIVAADCDGSQCFVQVCDNGD